MSRNKAQPGISNVPLVPTADFTGRREELDKLRQLFDARLTGTAIVVVHGLGGVGKTQIALRYARTFAAEYDVIWWLRGEQPATLASDFADLATRLRLPGRVETDQRLAVEAVKHWLARNARWLLVFDSVREPRDIEPYLVPGAPGQLLITSRHAGWIGMARLHVREMRRDESINLLLARSGIRDRSQRDQTAAAGTLAEALGDLPLALAQAAAFMVEHAIDFEQYLALFRERWQELMARGAAGDAPTVATTWDIAFRELRVRAPAAAELLMLCAFLAPDDIPRDGLREGAGECPPALRAALNDPLSLGEQIAALRRYSLIDAYDDTFSVHRLVQSVVRDRLGPEERVSWITRAAKLLHQIFPQDLDDAATWYKGKRWIPHASVVAERAALAHVALEEIEALYHNAASFCRLNGAFAESRELYRRAIALIIQLHGPQDHELGNLYRGLARTLEREGGDLAEARRLAQSALDIHLAGVGAVHQSIMRDHHTLLAICRAQGDRAAVEHHLDQLTTIGTQLYGAGDHRLIPYLNERAFILRDRGNLVEARRLLEQSLESGERHLGPEHPDVATLHSNLASVLEILAVEEFHRLNAEGLRTKDPAAAMSRAEEVQKSLVEISDRARYHAERAVEIGEKVYGPEHYAVAMRRNNLGILLQSIGDLEGAKEQIVRALAIGRRVLPAGHKRLTTFEKNLRRVEAALAGKR